MIYFDLDWSYFVMIDHTAVIVNHLCQDRRVLVGCGNIIVNNRFGNMIIQSYLKCGKILQLLKYVRKCAVLYILIVSTAKCKVMCGGANMGRLCLTAFIPHLSHTLSYKLK